MEEFFDVAFKYYGLDWIATILTMMSIHFLKHKSVLGFVFGVAASICWLGFTIIAASIAGMIANICFTFMYASGYIKWKKEKEEV